MLEQLTVKNVAVIDKLDVSLRDGVTVLTGETGAGKSIIIDSINMISGSRANKELVRRGTDKAEVQAVFSMCDRVKKILDENEIDTEDSCVIISRRLTADGKSTARINGTAVTLNFLREVADMLINIHGQHDNQALLNPEKHIDFVDAYAHSQAELDEYKKVYEKRRQINKKLKELEGDESEKMRMMDLYSYQVNEIKSAQLVSGEEEELIARRDILANAERINIAAQEAYADLYEFPNGRSAYDMISTAVNAVSGIADLSPELNNAYESLVSAMYAVEEAARDVHEFGGSIEYDEAELNETEERLELIGKLKRKYGSTIEEILSYCEKAEKKLNSIVTCEEQAEELQKQLAVVNVQLAQAAKALSAVRHTAATKLEKEIENSLHELDMEKAVFSVAVVEDEYNATGRDYVEFLIATNPGEDLKPLVKIASGGELSRVMLAIKSILAKSDDVGTLIFDEIDTGVSGSAAQRIADKLRVIGREKQVICISHLPQLASAADNHFRIVKDVDGEMAKTSLDELDYDGRVKELARIVGGGAAGEDYAREMLKRQHSLI